MAAVLAQRGGEAVTQAAHAEELAVVREEPVRRQRDARTRGHRARTQARETVEVGGEALARDGGDGGEVALGVAHLRGEAEEGFEVVGGGVDEARGHRSANPRYRSGLGCAISQSSAASSHARENAGTWGAPSSDQSSAAPPMHPSWRPTRVSAPATSVT